MHAHLVRATGLQLGLDPRGVAQPFHHAPVGDGLAPGPHLDRELLAVARVAPVQRLDATVGGRRLAHRQRLVNAIDVVRLERRPQRDHRRVVLGDHQQARGVLVDAVNDARAELAADAAQIADARQERVHQRPLRVTRSGMHHQPRRLVDDDQLRILVHHHQRDLLGD